MWFVKKKSEFKVKKIWRWQVDDMLKMMFGENNSPLLFLKFAFVTDWFLSDPLCHVFTNTSGLSYVA